MLIQLPSGYTIWITSSWYHCLFIIQSVLELHIFLKVVLCCHISRQFLTVKTAKWLKLLKNSTMSCRQSRRFLECIKGNFLSQIIDSPTRRDAILDLLLINTSELISDTIGGCLCCSAHAVMKLTLPRDTEQLRSKN